MRPLTPEEVKYRALVKDVLFALRKYADDAGIDRAILAAALRDWLTANHLKRPSEKS